MREGRVVAPRRDVAARKRRRASSAPARAIDIVLARYNLSNLERVFFEEIYDDVMLSDILAAHGNECVKFVRGSNLVGDKPEHSAITDGSSTCRN